jgi:hypothetical protein
MQATTLWKHDIAEKVSPLLLLESSGSPICRSAERLASTCSGSRGGLPRNASRGTTTAIASRKADVRTVQRAVRAVLYTSSTVVWSQLLAWNQHQSTAERKCVLRFPTGSLCIAEDEIDPGTATTAPPPRCETLSTFVPHTVWFVVCTVHRVRTEPGSRLRMSTILLPIRIVDSPS